MTMSVTVTVLYFYHSEISTQTKWQKSKSQSHNHTISPLCNQPLFLLPDLLCNSLLYFPSLAHVRLFLPRGPRDAKDIHEYVSRPLGDVETWEKAAVMRYVPVWWRNHVAVSHCAYAWPKGQTWEIEYPQMGSGLLVPEVEDYEPSINGGVSNADEVRMPYMGLSAVGKVRGVYKCVCGCSNVVWLGCEAVQETGRRVRIEVEFYESVDEPVKKGYVYVGMRLEENATPSPAARSVEGGSGIMFEPEEEEYWRGMRRRNRGWFGVLFRD